MACRATNRFGRQSMSREWVWRLSDRKRLVDDSLVVERRTIQVDGLAVSYLTAGADDKPLLLLLHGTYWSRVWQPVIAQVASAGLTPVSVDFPGCGRSEGELEVPAATLPALAQWVGRLLQALAPARVAGVAGHDIGGAVAQRLIVTNPSDFMRVSLVNSVTYDSWPVPSVARYRIPEIRAATGVAEFVEARGALLARAFGRPVSERELREYLDPWSDARVVRSWMSMAAAADSAYTLELMDALRADERPKLLVWGEQDTFQPIWDAERFALEVPSTRLIRVEGGHIPMENDSATVALELGHFFS